MRKSLQKTPHSALNSRLPSQPAALLGVGAASRHAVKGNGGVKAPHVAIEPRVVGSDGDHLAARLRLLEGFVSRTDVTECAQYALQWLGEAAAVRQSICMVKPAGEEALFAVAAHGMPGS